MSCFKDYFKRAFDFKGVSTRKEYWLLQIFVFLVSFFGMFFPTGGVLLMDEGYDVLGAIGMIIGFLIWAALLFPDLALIFRRLHDVNMSGWFILLSFVPLGNIAVFVMLLLDTEPVNNKWRENDVKRGRWVKYLDEDDSF